MARRLGKPPWFIKDYVKSAKELGMEACIIKNEKKSVHSTIRNLLEYRGDWFEGGIVIRPFTPLKYIEESPFGGPTFEEYRLFFFDGQLISVGPCGWFEGELEFVSEFENFGKIIPARFFSLDVVITEEGLPRILELGDGGVCEIPRKVDPLQFFTRIINGLEN